MSYGLEAENVWATRSKENVDIHEVTFRPMRGVLEYQIA